MGIFSSFSINSLTVPNHLALAPINTGLFLNGHLLPECFDFFQERSGSVGITYVGNAAISPELGTNPHTAYFSPENRSEWTELARIIRSRGSVPAIQLGCRHSHIPAMREWVNPNPDEYITQAREEIASLSRERLAWIMEQFLSSAKEAWNCGFPILQIHAAHGYLLSLLCSTVFNPREDGFNARDLEFLHRLASDLASLLPGAVLDIRISFLLGIQDAASETAAGFLLLDQLQTMPFHMISISNGIYNINKNYIYPPQSVSEEQYLSFGGTLLRRYPDKFWNIAGNLHNLNTISQTAEDRLVFSFGRQMICDPRFVEKYLAHREKEITLCTHCGECHYFSNQENALTHFIHGRENRSTGKTAYGPGGTIAYL